MSNPIFGGRTGLYFDDQQVPSGMVGQVCGVATINVADPAALPDGFFSTLSIDAVGRLRVQLGSTTLLVSPAITVDSLAVRTTTATPGAGGALATIAAPPAGTYDIDASVYFTVAGTANNAEFREGATVVGSMQVPPVVNQIPYAHKYRRVLDGATAISINATAADGVGTYSAMLIATRIA